MAHELQFYIDGAWVDPVTANSLDVIDPSTEGRFATISIGSAADIDRAVRAARTAFESFGWSDRQERLDLLHRIIDVYDRRHGDLAAAVSREMGAPLKFAHDVQVGIGRAHLKKMAEVLEDYAFGVSKGSGYVVKEPIGVVGMITPWNWPLNQILCKVAPALAAGCTMVLKPSEIAPLNAVVLAEILDEAGVPRGVFNLVNGEGATVGAAMAGHPGIDMVSFTGSTRAGIQVAKAAADTVKRVCQELGGKSPNILLRGAPLEAAVEKGVAGCYRNNGQSCNAPTRMLVPEELHDQAVAYAAAAAGRYHVGTADDPATTIGPVVSQAQFDKIQRLIESGIAEGATLEAGGPGRPDGLKLGYFVRPTVFGNVTPDMAIAREEIFGPVLSIMPYGSEDEAVAVANDSEYGLAAYVQSDDLSRARQVARRLRAGTVHINYPAWDSGMPFGGYKRSGNGREFAEYGLEDYLEVKGILGWSAA
ncbi:aldehyde dehydrogenase family protein [Lichenicoccus sp.]|uniref:aldehyde dehydrogenase family protein n=1 Tax=Lichenicoccus sp. TaxID=2781899 RepID=UPI003D0AE61C